MAMHKIELEYDDLEVMMAVLSDDTIFGRTIRAIFTHAVHALEQPPTIGDRLADVFILKECAKTTACAAKHAARQETNRSNAISGHKKQGHQVKQQGQSSDNEAAASGRKKAAGVALISKSDFNDLFYSLKEQALISPDKYKATKLYNQLLQDGWTLQGKSVDSLEQLEAILPLLLPYTDDSDERLNVANGYLFEALLRSAPHEAAMSTVLSVHAEIADTAENDYDVVYNTTTCMWTYDGHAYSERHVRELCSQVWTDWSEDNAEGDSS